MNEMAEFKFYWIVVVVVQSLSWVWLFCNPMDCSPPGSSVLYRAHPCMKCSFGISDFLEEISSLSHSVVFLYLFILISEEGFLISSCYSLELCIQMLISFLFSFAFHLPFFTAISKASSDSHFTFLHFFFLGMVLIPVSYTMSKFLNQNRFFLFF